MCNVAKNDDEILYKTAKSAPGILAVHFIWGILKQKMAMRFPLNHSGGEIC